MSTLHQFTSMVVSHEQPPWRDFPSESRASKKGWQLWPHAALVVVLLPGHTDDAPAIWQGTVLRESPVTSVWFVSFIEIQ